MSISREPIYQAILALLTPLTQGGTPLVATLTRRLSHWSVVPAGQMPYVCLAQGSEQVPKRKRGAPGVYTLRANIYVYVMTSGGQVPGTVINPILDAIQAALDPNATGVQTLGDLVQECWIEGEIATSEGTLGDYEVAIIPIVAVISG